jgi:hypothetical protein
MSNDIVQWQMIEAQHDKQTNYRPSNRKSSWCINWIDMVGAAKGKLIPRKSTGLNTLSVLAPRQLHA